MFVCIRNNNTKRNTYNIIPHNIILICSCATLLDCEDFSLWIINHCAQIFPNLD